MVAPEVGSREYVRAHWRDNNANPRQYAEADPKRSEFLVGLLTEYAPHGRILELGTNVGRNLHHLYEAGFTDLEGVDINPHALKEMRVRYPELADIPVHLGTIEDQIVTYADREFGCVFTMAVAMHIHSDSDWVFPHVARIAQMVMTIEDEIGTGNRMFPRDYGKVFGGLGMKQVYHLTMERPDYGLPRLFQARVFVHND